MESPVSPACSLLLEAQMQPADVMKGLEWWRCAPPAAPPPSRQSFLRPCSPLHPQGNRATMEREAGRKSLTPGTLKRAPTSPGPQYDKRDSHTVYWRLLTTNTYGLNNRRTQLWQHICTPNTHSHCPITAQATHTVTPQYDKCNRVHTGKKRLEEGMIMNSTLKV